MHRLRLQLRLLSVRGRLWRLWHRSQSQTDDDQRLNRPLKYESPWWWVVGINICFVFLSLISYDQNRFSFNSCWALDSLSSDVSLGLMNVTEAVSDFTFYIRCSPSTFKMHCDKFSQRHAFLSNLEILIQIFGIHHPQIHTVEIEKVCFHSFPPQVWKRRGNLRWPRFCQVFMRLCQTQKWFSYWIL